MNAVDFIRTGYENAITREELVRISGLDDRVVRRDIQEASAHGDLILNLQDGKGYFRPAPVKDDNYVKTWIKIMQSRVREENRKISIAERFVG